MKKLKKQIPGFVFTLPFTIGLLVFFIPVVSKGLRFAFSDVTIQNGLHLQWTGLENLLYALRVDPDFSTLLYEDLQNLVTTLPIILIFSLFVAVLLNTDVWGKGVFRAIFFLPVIVSVGLLTELDSGNRILDLMNNAVQSGSSEGISAISSVENILQSMKFSPELIGIVSGAANNIFDIVNRSGVQILIFLAGIQSISPSVYEAARVDGASAWTMFWKITLPMISPMILVNTVYTFMESITRDTSRLVKYMNELAFSKSEYGYASAMAWFQCFMIMLMLATIFGGYCFFRKKVEKTMKEG